MRCAMIIVWIACSSTITAGSFAQDDPTLKPKDNGYRGIWFTLGQSYDMEGEFAVPEQVQFAPKTPTP